MSRSQCFGTGSFIFLRFTTKKEKEHFPFRKRSIPCDLDGIQTHDLQNRNLTLYSAKLRDLWFFQTRAKIILFIQ